jgi:hypothetical protein
MAIISAFADLKKYIKPKSSTNVSTTIFKLNKLTCAFLLCCSILTTSKQFFGDPIHCMTGESPAIPLPVFESYCFMRSTYSHRQLDLNHRSSTHPGLQSGKYGVRGSNVVYHNYYQWVCLLMVIQAAICYSPWVYWKGVERSRISKLVEKVSKDPLTETPVKDQICGLGEFLINNSGWFNTCAFKLVLAQVICLVLSITQLYLMDVVMGYQFLHLGKHIFTLEQLSLALNKVFPIVVACDMKYFGHTGLPVQVSGMCTLPINIVNEKIYFILFVWYVFLIIVSVALIAWECFHIICSKLRLATLSRLVNKSPSGCRAVRFVTKRASYGDFVLLQLIARNIDTAQFESLMQHLYENSQNLLPLHSRHHSTSILEPEPSQRILSNEKAARGKEL